MYGTIPLLCRGDCLYQGAKAPTAEAVDSRSIRKVRSVYFQTALILFSPANATDPKQELRVRKWILNKKSN